MEGKVKIKKLNYPRRLMIENMIHSKLNLLVIDINEALFKDGMNKKKLYNKMLSHFREENIFYTIHKASGKKIAKSYNTFRKYLSNSAENNSNIKDRTDVIFLIMNELNIPEIEKKYAQKKNDLEIEILNLMRQINSDFDSPNEYTWQEKIENELKNINI
jgi:hypothetical protein